MRSMTKEFENEITIARLKIYLRELNKGMVPGLGKNQTRSDITRILLDLVAKKMSLYSEHNK